jgi:hypothetical protein
MSSFDAVTWRGTLLATRHGSGAGSAKPSDGGSRKRSRTGYLIGGKLQPLADKDLSIASRPRPIVASSCSTAPRTIPCEPKADVTGEAPAELVASHRGEPTNGT